MIWAYWHFFTITLNYYSSQPILTAEASLHSDSRSMSEFLIAVWISDWALLLWSLYSAWIHECTAFYNCLAARIEDTTLNSSAVVLLVITEIFSLALVTW
jgi:hypothetical protein